MDNNNTPDSTDQSLQLNRRRLLKTGLGAVGGAAAMGLLPSLSSIAYAAPAALETTKAKLGFIALTDAAPCFSKLLSI